MVFLLAGASHTGKTALAQRLLEQYHYPYLSIDHLKMGLIRSGNTNLTAMSDDRVLTAFLWPILREIVKTAVENGQTLVMEGCYIPFDWQKDFAPEYLANIRYCCLIMSENYIRTHFSDIRGYANTIEQRVDDTGCTVERLIAENAQALTLTKKHHADYILIDDQYNIPIARFAPAP